MLWMVALLAGTGMTEDFLFGSPPEKNPHPLIFAQHLETPTTIFHRTVTVNEASIREAVTQNSANPSVVLTPEAPDPPSPFLRLYLLALFI